MAEKLGITQPSYADWERRTVALKPEYLPQLAALLGVGVRAHEGVDVLSLLGAQERAKRGAGPVGRARAVFERVSQLPRATQQRILANVEDALTAYEVRKAG